MKIIVRYKCEYGKFVELDTGLIQKVEAEGEHSVITDTAGRRFWHFLPAVKLKEEMKLQEIV